ncbi:MAG: hypothetical protein ACXW3D_00200 [Caulobacteraceae bacterium]
MDALSIRYLLQGRRLALAGQGEAADRLAARLKSADVVRLTGAEAFDAQAWRGAALAFIASDDDVFAQTAFRAAKSAGLPVFAENRPALCDFELAPEQTAQASAPDPAASEGGVGERLQGFLHHRRGGEPPPGSGRVAALLKRVQERMHGATAGLGERREIMREIMRGPAGQAAAEGDMETAERLARETLERRKARS